MRFPENIVEKLLDLKFWDMNIKDIRNVDFTNIYKAISQLQDIRDSGTSFANYEFVDYEIINQMINGNL